MIPKGVTLLTILDLRSDARYLLAAIVIARMNSDIRHTFALLRSTERPRPGTKSSPGRIRLLVANRYPDDSNLPPRRRMVPSDDNGRDVRRIRIADDDSSSSDVDLGGLSRLGLSLLRGLWWWDDDE